MTIGPIIRDMIPVLIQWATVRPQVRAVLLTSTRAIPDAQIDVLSDYDVILIVQDIHPFVAERTWLSDFGDVLVVYWDPIHPNAVFGTEQCGNVTQYADGLKTAAKLTSLPRGRCYWVSRTPATLAPALQVQVWLPASPTIAGWSKSYFHSECHCRAGRRQSRAAGLPGRQKP